MAGLCNGFAMAKPEYTLLPAHETDKVQTHGSSISRCSKTVQCVVVFASTLTIFMLMFCQENTNTFEYFAMQIRGQWDIADVEVEEDFARRNYTPKVLVYTKFFGSNLRDILRRQTCDVECFYGDKSEISLAEADAVFFHTRDMPAKPSGELLLPEHQRPGQYFVAMVMESPYHTGFNSKHMPPIGYFDVVMDYRVDPLTYFWGYGILEEAKTEEQKGLLQPMTDDQFKKLYGRKESLALVMISNCNAISGRDRYLTELRKHATLTLVGACFKKTEATKCPRKSGGAKSCEDVLIESHFFYIAFENSVCPDYVTEKFWRLKQDIVPVVLKRTMYAKLAPNSSFIAADDFASPKELAEYLQKVAADPALYRKLGQLFCLQIRETCRDLRDGKVKTRPNLNAEEYYSTNYCEKNVGSKLSLG